MPEQVFIGVFTRFLQNLFKNDICCRKFSAKLSIALSRKYAVRKCDVNDRIILASFQYNEFKEDV